MPGRWHDTSIMWWRKGHNPGQVERKLEKKRYWTGDRIFKSFLWADYLYRTETSETGEKTPNWRQEVWTVTSNFKSVFNVSNLICIKGTKFPKDRSYISWKNENHLAILKFYRWNSLGRNKAFKNKEW